MGARSVLFTNDFSASQNSVFEQDVLFQRILDPIDFLLCLEFYKLFGHFILYVSSNFS